MKLYYYPGACSLGPHIVLREAGAPFEAINANIRTKTLPDGSDYLAVNPKGAVPALQLDTGDVLTENTTIMQYVADMGGTDDLIPKSGIARYRQLEWMSYVSSEIHKTHAPLFNPQAGEDAKAMAKEMLAKKYKYVVGALGDKPYLTGDAFTPADAYLYVMLTWAKKFGIETGLDAYRDRVAARPAVQEAERVEAAG